MAMTSQDGEHEIRNDPGRSSYFQGGYRGYGRYQWNCKFYDWENFEFEVEDARRYFFGEYIHKRQAYEQINDIIGRSDKAPWVKCGFEGHSGGWFVVYEELEEDELQKLDQYIKDMMDNGLASYLKEERAVRDQEAKDAEQELRERKQRLLSDKRLGRILAQLHKHYRNDFVLMVEGIDIVKAHAELLTEPEKVLG